MRNAKFFLPKIEHSAKVFSMKMRDFLKSRSNAEREMVAAKAGTSVDYLWQISGGHRKPSVALSRRLVDASDGALTLYELRPDIFDHPSKSQTNAA
jgi:hypothetical protein